MPPLLFARAQTTTHSIQRRKIGALVVVRVGGSGGGSESQLREPLCENLWKQLSLSLSLSLLVTTCSTNDDDRHRRGRETGSKLG